MKFISNKENFKKIGELLKVTDKIFPNVRISENENGTVEFCVSNGSISLALNVKCMVEENTPVCVNAKKFVEILSRIERSFSFNDGVISFEKSNVTLPVINTSDFLSVNGPDAEIKEIKTEFIQNSIKNVDYACCASQRGILSGISFKDCEVAATDGNRLTVYSVETGLQDVVIPKNVTDLIVNCFDRSSVLVSCSDQKIMLQDEKFMLIAPVLNGTFPNYKGIIPRDYEKSVLIPRKQVLKAIDLLAIMQEDLIKTVKFVFKKDRLLTLATSDKKNDIEIDVDCTEDFEIDFNLLFIKDIFQNTTEDEIKMKYATSTTLVVFEAGDNKIDVVMPLVTKDRR